MDCFLRYIQHHSYLLYITFTWTIISFIYMTHPHFSFLRIFMAGWLPSVLCVRYKYNSPLLEFWFHFLFKGNESLYKFLILTPRCLCWLNCVNDTAKFWFSAEFWLSGAIDIAKSWLSGVIGDLKIEYLGEFKIKKYRETVPSNGRSDFTCFKVHSKELKIEGKN